MAAASQRLIHMPCPACAGLALQTNGDLELVHNKIRAQQEWADTLAGRLRAHAQTRRQENEGGGARARVRAPHLLACASTHAWRSLPSPTAAETCLGTLTQATLPQELKSLVARNVAHGNGCGRGIALGARAPAQP